jgi:hypothetical protein
MRCSRLLGLLTLLMLVVVPTAAANPNMIRLGYPNCASCHVSPQGGGLLTRYGEGIDLSQTLRPDEPDDPELGEDGLGSRLNYDVRLSAGIDRDPPARETYGFNLSLRTAIGFLPQHRLVYSSGIRSPILGPGRPSGTVTVGMTKLHWLYQPKPGLAFVIGRDELPSGLGLPGAQAFARRIDSPNVSSTPTQAKVFWWNKRWELTAYGFGPDGDEIARRFRARGGGALAGVNVWKDRAVVGLTTRVSRADAFESQNAGIFVRLGLTRSWGILVEHDVTRRTTDTQEDFTHLAGHSQLFFIPRDWLQTALAVEHVTTSGGRDTYRLSPSIQARLTGNVKVLFTMRDAHAATDSRTYSFEVQVKTQ